MLNDQAIHNLEQQLTQIEGKIRETLAMISKNPELAELAMEELKNLNLQKESLAGILYDLREKKGHQSRLTNRSTVHPNAIIEIRAATGGSEAGLFAVELYRMYLRFSEDQGWKTHQLSISEGGLKNIKEVIFEITGSAKNPAYPKLKYESGVHRVQRVPITESAGRIHTSTVTVAVLPKVVPEKINIQPTDLKVETFRSRGPGGQSVNTTDSAVRITHLPTGISVSVQDEKSQHQNRQKALEILSSRIFQLMQNQQKETIDELRSGQIGMGERSEKIRTYNFPQHRVTDHRINKSWYNLQEILEGNLTEIITALAQNPPS